MSCEGTARRGGRLPGGAVCRLASLLLAAGAASAPAARFRHAAGDWTNAANWNSGLPSFTATAVIGYDGSGAAPDATVYIRAGNACTADRIAIGSYASAGPTRGRLVVEGGALAYDNGLVLGEKAGATGTLVQTGGSITGWGGVHHAVGTAGHGRMELLGGFLTLSNGLRVAYAAGGSGTLTLDHGACLTVGSDVLLGNTARGVAVVSNGTVSCTQMRLGYGAGGYGSLTVLNGAVTCSGGSVNSLTLAENSSGATGEVTVASGGTLALSKDARVPDASGACGALRLCGGLVTNAARLRVGVGADSRGTVVVSDGGRYVGAGSVDVGIDGSALLIVSNGSFGAADRVDVDRGQSPGSRVELAGARRLLRVGSVLQIGDLGRVDVRVSEHTGGVDLLWADDAAWPTNSAGPIAIAFEGDPVEAGHYWGLRWRGDRTAVLRERQRDRRLRWDDSGLSRLFKTHYGVSIYYDAGTDSSYVGANVTKVPVWGLGIVVR